MPRCAPSTGVAVGALIGGGLGDALGLVPTLLIGATGSLSSSGWVVF